MDSVDYAITLTVEDLKNILNTDVTESKPRYFFN